MQINLIFGLVLLVYGVDSLIAAIRSKLPLLMDRTPGEEKWFFTNIFFSLFILSVATMALVLPQLSPTGTTLFLAVIFTTGGSAVLGIMGHSIVAKPAA
jgi:hypothetical protein